MEEISSRKNQHVRFVRELLRSAQLRGEQGLFAAEGDHLCKEAARSIGTAELFLYTKRAAEKYPEAVGEILKISETSLVITEELSEYISDTKSPQGLFAAVKMPSAAMPDAPRKIVVLDGVQDPGNVGTVIRTAEALGIDGVVLLNGCADIFSPKTLRASMGSALRMPVINAGNTDELKEILSGFTIYAAMLDKSAKRLGGEKFPEKTAVVIGSEGGGVSEEVADICGERLYIPIKKAESLNAAVAAAIILWEISR